MQLCTYTSWISCFASKSFHQSQREFYFCNWTFFLPLNEVPSSVGTSALYCRSYWLEQQSMLVQHRSRRGSYQQTDKKWAKVLRLLHAAAAAAASVSEAWLLVHRLLFQTWLLTSVAGSRKAATADCYNLPSAASDLFFLSFFLPAHLHFWSCKFWPFLDCSKQGPCWVWSQQEGPSCCSASM